MAWKSSGTDNTYFPFFSDRIPKPDGAEHAELEIIMHVVSVRCITFIMLLVNMKNATPGDFKP